RCVGLRLDERRGRVGRGGLVDRERLIVDLVRLVGRRGIKIRLQLERRDLDHRLAARRRRRRPPRHHRLHLRRLGAARPEPRRSSSRSLPADRKARSAQAPPPDSWIRYRATGPARPPRARSTPPLAPARARARAPAPPQAGASAEAPFAPYTPLWARAARLRREIPGSTSCACQISTGPREAQAWPGPGQYSPAAAPGPPP